MMPQLALTTPTPIRGKVLAYQWPSQGQWTYADYLRLPDDGRRYEIIDKVLYMANAPSYQHQYTVTKLARVLDEYVEHQKLGVVLVAPFEIHLSDLTKPVQPDVLFIAKERQPRPNAQLFEGIPDLIVEVVSPSSIRLDRHIKFAAYERAGVREYWLVDPRFRMVEVYTLENDLAEYTLHGQFGIGEQIQSLILPTLSVATEAIFVPS